MGCKTKVIRAGAKVLIRALATTAEEGKRDPCATLKFCQEIKETHSGELAKLVRLWDDIAHDGPPANDQKFKDLSGTDGLYEMKTTQLRVICFWDDGNLIICTHGFIKKSKKTPRKEIERAQRAKTDYFNDKKQGTLKHDPVPGRTLC